MRRIAALLLSIGAGLALARLAHLDVAGLPRSTGYRLGAYLLLAVGLYGATYGIDLRQARRDRKVIAAAVTVGVVAKALLIGGVLALAWRDPLFLVLGVAVAQIDPLSVAALVQDRRMSPRARNVLAAWSSFDDPFTVVLSIYAAATAVNVFGLGAAPPSATSPLLLYAVDLGGNLAVAGLAWVGWRAVRRWAWAQYALLLAVLVVAVATGWMLAIALVGLFARPAGVQRLVGPFTQVALYTAATGLGLLLAGGVSVVAGLTLGVAAFAAQAVVAVPLTRGMPPVDRWHLALAQQNGITAIILALTLEIQFNGVVAVVAPGIIVANLVHALANQLADRRLGPAGHGQAAAAS